MPRIKKLIALAVSLALLVLLFLLYWRMDAYRDSVDRRETLIAGSIPAHIYLPEVEKPPIVIVAHGFTANKEMMQSLDYSLVRDGFAVVSFDFRGHGQNTTAFDHDRLQEDMEQVIEFATHMNSRMPVPFGRKFKEVDTERIAIMGHSMGGGAIVNYGVHHPDIDATIPISGVSAGVTNKLPKNLFIIYAKNDPPDLHQAAWQMLDGATEEEEQSVADTTYGDFERGSARRLSMVEKTDHITILFSAEAHDQMLDWLHQVWDLPPGQVKSSDPRLAWMGLMYIISFLLFLCCCYGLSWYLPSISQRTGRETILNMVAFVVVCFLALFVLMLAPPLSFIPMPTGDYLISYFFVVGVIFFIMASRRGNIYLAVFKPILARTLCAAFVLFLLVYCTFGTITTEVWFRQLFTGQRLLWALAIAPLLLPFFGAFEASFKRGNTLVALAASLAGILIALGMLVVGIKIELTDSFIMLIIIPMVIYNVLFQLRWYWLGNSRSCFP